MCAFDSLAMLRKMPRQRTPKKESEEGIRKRNPKKESGKGGCPCQEKQIGGRDGSMLKERERELLVDFFFRVLCSESFVISSNAALLQETPPSDSTEPG
jgi:hypothetical protein